MKIRFTITGEYDVPEDKLQLNYGTTDHQQALAIDQTNAEEDSSWLLGCYDHTVRLEEIAE